MQLLLKAPVTAFLVSFALLPSLSALESFQTQSEEQQADALPWPPLGPTWESDPSIAFERARNEDKTVMAYVATAN